MADRQLPRTVAEAILALCLPGDLAWLPVDAAEERLCYCNGPDERFTVARLRRDKDGWTLWDVTGRRIAVYGKADRAPLDWASGWLRIPRTDRGDR